MILILLQLYTHILHFSYTINIANTVIQIDLLVFSKHVLEPHECPIAAAGPVGADPSSAQAATNTSRPCVGARGLHLWSATAATCPSWRTGSVSLGGHPGQSAELDPLSDHLAMSFRTHCKQPSQKRRN